MCFFSNVVDPPRICGWGQHTATYWTRDLSIPNGDNWTLQAFTTGRQLYFLSLPDLPNYWLSPRLPISTCVPSLSATAVRSVRHHHHGLWERLLHCRKDPCPCQLLEPTLQWEVIRLRLSAYSSRVIRGSTGACTTHSLAMQRLLLFSSLLALGYNHNIPQCIQLFYSDIVYIVYFLFWILFLFSCFHQYYWIWVLEESEIAKQLCSRTKRNLARGKESSIPLKPRLCLHDSVIENVPDFSDFQVFRATPKTREEADFLHSLRLTATHYDFWTEVMGNKKTKRLRQRQSFLGILTSGLRWSSQGIDSKQFDWRP